LQGFKVVYNPRVDRKVSAMAQQRCRFAMQSRMSRILQTPGQDFPGGVNEYDGHPFAPVTSLFSP
jgi:hypothetical protein